MTLGQVRGFFRGRLDALGYTEWVDGFNTDNIPSTILDRSYHLAVGEISSSPANQLHHTFEYPITVSVVFKGFRDPSGAIDESLDAGQIILEDILAPEQRLGLVDVKDIRPVSINARPLAESNDNVVVLEIEFSVLMILAFC